MGDAYKCIATRSAAQPSDCTDSQQCLAGLLQNPETEKNKACLGEAVPPLRLTPHGFMQGIRMDSSQCQSG